MALVPSTSVGSASAGSGAVTQIYDNVAVGAIASWDVPGIAGTYAHLQIVMQARGDTAAALIATRVQFNGDTSAIYDYDILQSSLAAGALSSETFGTTGAFIGFVAAATATADIAPAVTVVIPNYAGTTFNKAIIAANAFKQSVAAQGTDEYFAGAHWRSNAAIARVTIFPTAGNFVAGSRLSIYGLT